MMRMVHSVERRPWLNLFVLVAGMTMEIQRTSLLHYLSYGDLFIRIDGAAEAETRTTYTQRGQLEAS
jgi:hypothetical protein